MPKSDFLSVNRPRAFLGFLVFIGLLGLGVYFFLNWKSERQLAKAGLECFQSGDLLGTLQFAGKLYQRNPESHAAARLLALGYERIDPELAMQWWKRAWELQPSDFEAYARLLTLSMNSVKREEVLSIIQSAPADFLALPDYHKLAAAAYLKAGYIDSAHQAFNRARELREEDWEAHLGLLLIEARARDIGQADQALENILRLTEPGNPAEAQALYNLVTSDLHQRLTAEQVIEFTDRYLEMPGAVFSKRLKLALAAAARSSASLSKQDLWFQALEDEAGLSVSRLAEYGQAMNEAGQSPRVLSLRQTMESQREHVPFFNDIVLEAMLREQLWMDVVPWVDQIPDDQRSPWHRIAREVALGGGKSEDVRTAILQKILQSASGPGQLRWVIQRARSHQWDRIVEAALWAECDIPGAEMRASRELFEWFRSRGEGRGLYLAAEEVLKSDPKNLTAKATVAHLSLCLQMNPGRASRFAEECYQAQPSSAPLRMIYLLSLHLRGENQEVMRLLSDFRTQDREMAGMGLYFDYFDWITGKSQFPPDLEKADASYLDVEIALLEELIRKKKNETAVDRSKQGSCH